MTENETHTIDVVQAFAAVARPIILNYFNRGSCIASSRITIEVLKHYGIEASAKPVAFVLEVPTLKAAYVMGLNKEQKELAQKQSASFVEMASGPAYKGGDGSWNGHLIVHGDDFLIDPSFDQALDGLARHGNPIPSQPMIAVFPLGGKTLPDEFHAALIAVLDDGTQVKITYTSIDDDSFLRTPAWETDHLQIVIDQVIAAMERLAGTTGVTL